VQAVFSAVFVRGVIRVFGTLQREFSAWNEGSGYFHVAEARAGTRELWLMEKDKSIPVLPSRSLERTIRFYSRLGFEGRLLAMGTWAIVTRGDLELHFFPYPQLQPAENYGGVTCGCPMWMGWLRCSVRRNCRGRGYRVWSAWRTRFGGCVSLR